MKETIRPAPVGQTGESRGGGGRKDTDRQRKKEHPIHGDEVLLRRLPASCHADNSASAAVPGSGIAP